MKSPAIYILASQRNGTLYIGVTSNLVQRVWQHREGLAEGFTKQYSVKTLVWYELHETMESAIGREKAMKKWLRKWKLTTIEKTNPNWSDLWSEILGTETAASIPVSPAIIPASPSVAPAFPAVVPAPPVVIPANAGTQEIATSPVIPAHAATQQLDDDLDSRIRGNDDTQRDAR